MTRSRCMCSTRLQLSFLAFRELLNLIEVQFTDRSELEPVVERIFERIVGQVIRKVGHLGSHWGWNPRRNSMGGSSFSVAADGLVFPIFFLHRWNASFDVTLNSMTQNGVSYERSHDTQRNRTVATIAFRSGDIVRLDQTFQKSFC